MSSRVITIGDQNVEVGIAPDIGARVVSLCLKGEKNLLKAPHAIWSSKPKKKTAFGPRSQWRAYNGQIVWAGPQSEWWTHQEKSPHRKQKKATWPPDPFFEYGWFTVVEKSSTHVILKGPESEFSGLRLTKTIRIDSKSRILFKVEAQNIRNQPVAWDLWLNARFDGYCRCYVPVESPVNIRTEGKENSKQNKSQFTHTQGYFCLEPKAPSAQCKFCMAKAFIDASKGFMAAFADSQAIIIHFEKHHKSLIHPQHSLVEIYNYTTHNRADALNELEYHSPYIKLNPAEWMETEQQWEIHPFNCSPKSHTPYIEFLKGVTQ